VNEELKNSIDRQMEQINIAIERLEKSIEKLYKEDYEEQLSIVMDEAFEDGYVEGYDHGAEDVYSALKAEITE
jgi:flagellar biosynthesis/type III secretory pathway protein FliH